MGEQPGQLQVLGKFAKASFEEGLTDDYDQDTTEINVNYIIKEHNARVMFFFRNTTFSAVRQDSEGHRHRPPDPMCQSVVSAFSSLGRLPKARNRLYDT